MSKYIKRCTLIIVFELLFLAAANLIYIVSSGKTEDREYRVSANRIKNDIESVEDIDKVNLDDYQDITGIGIYTPGMVIDEDYLVIALDNEESLAYVTYESDQNKSKTIFWINGIAMLAILVNLISFIYIGNTVIKPFHRIRELPYELSKGNLTVPVKEEKNKVFGQFLWGMDLLRENLEDSKEEELRLQKEKKTLLLSISHDIKTPLSSIKLYAKALNENLYENEEKKLEVYESIGRNADDIENYVNQIIKASKEDFLNLSVEMENAYLSDVLNSIDELYKDKLSPLNTKWELAPFENCLLSCDKERLIEVLQNIMENAIKYGDGGYIRLTVDEEENCKLIRIENSGEPIKEDELPHVFDSFYRGTNIKSKKGSGLGLYICRTLMQLMDGDIFAERLAEGNAFTVVVRKG